jgi:hypothetical protein
LLAHEIEIHVCFSACGTQSIVRVAFHALIGW